MNINKKDYTGTIKSIKKVALDTFKIDILSELDYAIAGQFISILCPPKTLRRPFSIMDFDKENKTVSIIFKVKGEGTSYLSNLKENDKVQFLAPLGNGFELYNKKALLVGAGIGVAPMLFLKKELNKKSIENYLVSGFKEKDEVVSGSDENIIGGSVLDKIPELIKEKNIEIIYSCGPKIVLEKLCAIAKEFQLPCFIAMEKVMACSIGVCRGCVIKVKKENEVINKSVCQDGPIFKGNEIIW